MMTVFKSRNLLLLCHGGLSSNFDGKQRENTRNSFILQYVTEFHA